MDNIKDIKFSVITPSDNDYSGELELRNDVLWKTSGLNIYDKALNESEDFHIIGKIENELIACLLLTKLDDKILLMREVSVKKSHQGLGIGKMLTAFSEEVAKNNGYKKIEIHNARLNVVPFYEKQGYLIAGNEFIESGIKRRKMEKIIIKDMSSKSPYGLGFLGLIPLVGFFVGIGLTLYGIIKYKDKKLAIIGIACMVFTVIVYSVMFYVGFKSDMGIKAWERHAQMQLNSLVKHIEFYKLENGQYPDSLQQFKGMDEFIFIIDPTQSVKNRKNTYYNYKNLGDKYLLFSSGADGIPNTEDDIFPKIESNNENIGWTRYEAN